MEYKNYIDQRLEGMYAIIENCNSVVLEEYKKQKNNNVKKALSSFYNFLKNEHPKKADECKKDPNKLAALIKNKSTEFNEFVDKHPWVLPLFTTVTFAYLSNIAIGVIAGVAVSLDKSKNKEANASAVNRVRHDQDMIHMMHMM